MDIIVFSGSSRKNSQSSKIAILIKEKLKLLKTNPDIIDLNKTKFPIWEEDEDNKASKHKILASQYSDKVNQAMGFVFIVPEWNGMVPPQVKNLFFIFSNKHFAHKPGLIISISDANGGAYPIAELRSFSYKNKKICWIPEHIIIRKVTEFNPDKDLRLVSRIDYSCRIFIDYAEALINVRKSADYDNFNNGM